MRYIFDIETNGFLDECDTAHCIVLKDIDTNEIHKLDNKSAVKKLEEAEKKERERILYQKQKLQVQIDGKASIVENKKTYWDKLNDKQRDDYKIIPFPGKKISFAKDYEFNSSDDRFEVINIKFRQMDILELSSTGHCRAKCIFTKNSRKEYWVAP